MGRELCARLVAQGESVAVLDNCRYGPSRVGVLAGQSLKFHRVDLRDATGVQRVIQEERPSVVVHLAALHYIPECEGDPSLACETNLTGTINLLQSCPSDTHFVFTSSGAVYAPEDRPHLEDTSPTVPSDVYGFTKLHGEQYVRYFAEKRRFPATVVRLFNVVGEGETSPHFIPELMAQLLAGQSEIHAGTLTTRRDYIDVLDVAEGFHRLLKHERAGEMRVVNLGTGVTHSGHEVIELLRAVSGRELRVVLDPTRVRKVDRPNLAADTTKLRATIGWTPKSTLEACLRRTWRNPMLPSSLLTKYQLQ